ncbi:XTP/dITP diphosphohydrolase [Flavobacteriaceae bacterium MAR_2010_188]|nr:XTP/dITP diphosphohydrolase [Flavobacteriaceae bacterium MAR_2010_188]
MKKLVFATHNDNKVKEVLKFLPSAYEILSLQDIDCFEDIPETQFTIEGNAEQKAQFVSQKYKVDCFADDTGLLIKSLNGEPGVFSARYAGEDKNPKANIAKVLKELENHKDRSAHFKTVIALQINGELNTFTGICEGQIIKALKGEDGFGYDPIFVPNGYSKTFAEMSLEEKNEISHRGKAIRKLTEFLNSN